ncbi:MAG: HNH endonuclease [Saprospiraceae bacterium]
MSQYISGTLRQLVINRANNRCEYCKIFAIYSFLSFHIEHIISVKHGGQTIQDNLAYSCPICNLNKGSDIATILNTPTKPIRFFNPRIDNWDIHFKIELSGFIVAQTEIGEATIKILDLNHPDSIIEREILITNGMF